MGYGVVAKWITKRRERSRNRRMEKKAMRGEYVESRFPGE
jgi:hypothetical protein